MPVSNCFSDLTAFIIYIYLCRPRCQPKTPTYEPSTYPTPTPSIVPSTAPTPTPSFDPTFSPSQIPTASPTFKPSAEPTTSAPSSPGAVNTVIAASQSLTGISASTWNEDAATNCNVFGLTIETVTNGAVLASEVGNCVVTDNRSRALEAMLNEFARRILQATVSSTIAYTITLPVSTDVSATTALAATITATISTSVTSGNFTATLKAVAVANNVAVLANVSSSDFASTVVVTSGPSLPKDTKLTDGQIAGIVIGVLIGSFVVAGLVYYLINVRRANAGFTESLIQDGEAAQEGLVVVPHDLEARGDSFLLVADDRNDSRQVEEMQVVTQSDEETRI